MSEPFEFDWTSLQYTAYFAALYPALLGASVIDWRSHQIPNSLVLFVAATGWLVHLFLLTSSSVRSAALTKPARFLNRVEDPTA